MKTDYSPFPEGDFPKTAGDLQALKAVREGWFIEYKREQPSSKTVGKSISAFANTYGGWLFIGVDEMSKEEPVAGAFPGIPDTQVDSALNSIRSTVSNSIFPSPYFDTFVFPGPCEELPLARGSSVLCIHVPMSPNAPHISIGGQIYRRVGDSSEPKSETDRAILDQLWHRRDKIQRHYRQWLKQDPKCRQGDVFNPILRILLVADLWRTRQLKLDLRGRQGQIRQLFKEGTPGVSLPFDTVHEFSGGIIARQCLNNDPSRLTMTWRLGADLDSEFQVPLNIHSGKLDTVLNRLEGYKYAMQFIKALHANGYKEASVVDLNQIILLAASVVCRLRQIQEFSRFPENYHAKIRLTNILGRIPFLDTSQFIDDCNKFGIPQCQTNTSISPVGKDPDSFLEIDYFETESKDAYSQQIIWAHPLFLSVFLTFGVSFWKTDDGIDIDFSELLDAGQRAMARQNSGQR